MTLSITWTNSTTNTCCIRNNWTSLDDCKTQYIKNISSYKKRNSFLMSLMEIPSCYCKFADGKRLSSRLLLMLVDANGRMLAKTRTELRVIKETLITFNFKQMVHLWLKARLFHIHIFLNRGRSKQTSRLVFKVFS